MRQRQVLRDDVVKCESCSCMAFANASVSLVYSFRTKEFGAADTVADVRLRAVTFNGRCVHAYYSDVMKHGSFAYEVGVDV